MCGLFAYAGPTPPVVWLLRAAADAARRGPHGHGWMSQHGGSYGHGPLDPGTLPQPAAVGTWVVGHSRLATTGGDPHDVTGLQPVVRGGHVLAHNGSVDARWWQLYHPAARTDSHALADQYARLRDAGDGPQEALKALTTAGDPQPYVIVVRDATGALLAARHRLPLWQLTHCDGIYLSSVRMPDAVPLPDQHVKEWPS